jgi:hypothetical protein
MKEDAISSSGDPLFAHKSSSPPPTPTPAASSAGASSPAVQANVGSIDWLGHGQGGSKAGSVTKIGSQPIWTSMSASAGGGSALGSSQPSCRPWERGDLLQRLSTYKPNTWFGKPKAANSLACARRGWVNLDVDKIECESCGANLNFIAPAGMPEEADNFGEEFAKTLDYGHKVNCPWRGNSCAESLVQFPPTPPSALIGGYKDRCDGLLQFISLPIVSASAIEQIRLSRGPEIDRFLMSTQTFTAGESGIKIDIMSTSDGSRSAIFSAYSHSQKLISLCGWEPRWLPNVQDCEEHSAQSARNGYSVGPTKGQEAGPSKKAMYTSPKKDSEKKEMPKSKRESRSPLLDCSLCGATVRIWDFLTVNRPSRFAPSCTDMPEASKKIGLTRGVSAASGISGWVATEDHDEAGTADLGKSISNIGVDLNLTMGGGFSSSRMDRAALLENYQDANIGRDLIIGQPSSSEVGDRATSYESRGPSTRKRNLDEGGSTVDRPQLIARQADSVEGSVIDRDGDEVDDGKQYSAGPSKRSRESSVFETYNSSSYWRESPGAGPSTQPLMFDIERNEPSTRDSARVSSVIAMETYGQGGDTDSMESVENYPGDMDDVAFKNPDLNEASELNYSNPAQLSTCPAVPGAGFEIGVSSTNEEEVVNTDTVTGHGRGEGFSFGISGGSVGMGASHEAEIHGGADMSIHRTDSVVGDVEPVGEVTENQGQTGEFGPDPGLMGDFVPEEIDQEYSQDLMSRSVARADSGSKIVGSTAKADSVESGEKTSNMNVLLPHENSNHPSLSCNAILCSGHDASKDEVSQADKSSPTDESNGIGAPNGESNYEEGEEFDPIKHHNNFCPWVNGNVAAAGCTSSSGSSSTTAAVALCGWQLTLDALDAFQSLGHLPMPTVQSESAASLYKDDHRNPPSRKLLAHHSFSKTHGQN